MDTAANMAKHITTGEKAHAVLNEALKYTGEALKRIQSAPLSMSFNGMKPELINGVKVPLNAIARLRPTVPTSGPVTTKQALQVATVLVVSAKTLARTDEAVADKTYQLWPAFQKALIAVLQDVKTKAIAAVTEVVKGIGWPAYLGLGLVGLALVYKVAK